jgi:hypothetical protein
MLAIEAVDGSETETHSMQTQWIVSAGALEGVNRRAAIVEIVFGMRFDPADCRTLVEQRLVMNSPETDSGASRNRTQGLTS